MASHTKWRSVVAGEQGEYCNITLLQFGLRCALTEQEEKLEVNVKCPTTAAY